MIMGAKKKLIQEVLEVEQHWIGLLPNNLSGC